MHIITLQVDGPFHIQLNVRTGNGMATETEIGGTDDEDQGLQPGADQGAQQPGADQVGVGAGSVNVAQDPAYGEYLTDAEGRALYTHTGTEDGFFVGEGWEPVIAGDDDLPGSGVDPALMGEIERDGVRYRTYANRPLYRYSGDTEPGAITGHGADESWWAVGPTGEAIQTP